jgi:hypothetical protein
MLNWRYFLKENHLGYFYIDTHRLTLHCWRFWRKKLVMSNTILYSISQIRNGNFSLTVSFSLGLPIQG